MSNIIDALKWRYAVQQFDTEKKLYLKPSGSHRLPMAFSRGNLSW
jgi:hypothetical protein